MRGLRGARIGALLALLTPLCASAASSDFAEAAPERLAAYLQIDTINPPGNETRGVAFLAEVLDAAGIDYETAESAPGRGNLWARLEGGRRPGLVLLHHIDVVPASEKHFDTATKNPEGLHRGPRVAPGAGASVGPCAPRRRSPGL